MYTHQRTVSRLPEALNQMTHHVRMARLRLTAAIDALDRGPAHASHAVAAAAAGLQHTMQARSVAAAISRDLAIAAQHHTPTTH
jgi:hypothetical protein